MPVVNIAIDGPSGAGKSTLSRRAAQELGILYVDTGAFYRTIACYIRQNNIKPENEAEITACLPEIHIRLSYEADGLQHMLLNSEDVTDQIRLPEISQYASVISAYPAVRAFLLDTQRELARQHSLIMDGRDIGTVVLPDAQVKIFLMADVEIRARRRMKELEQRGIPEDFDRVLEDMILRDKQDMQRETAPLRPADDAIILDTSKLNFEESLAALLALIRERMQLS